MQLYMGRGETQMEEASDMEFCLSPSLFPQNIWSVLATTRTEWFHSCFMQSLRKKFLLNFELRTESEGHIPLK